MDTDPSSTETATPQNADTGPIASTKGHEDSDVDPLGILTFGVGLAVLLLGVLAACVLMFRVFGRVDDQIDAARKRREPGAAALVQARPDYSGPLLQIVPEEDLKAMHADNAANLTGYGWADKNAGVVRIPIDRAMELLAQRGLPPTAPAVSLEEMQRQRNQIEVYRQNLQP